jgi:hypothetical protein
MTMDQAVVKGLVSAVQVKHEDLEQWCTFRGLHSRLPKFAMWDHGVGRRSEN